KEDQAPNGSDSSFLPPPSSFRRRRLLAVLALLVLLAAGGGYLWLRPRSPEPPRPALADADPAVVEAIDAARTEVRAAPRSAAAWGKLGMLLLAHGYAADAGVCFTRAEALGPNEARWPNLHAVALQDDPG